MYKDIADIKAANAEYSRTNRLPYWFGKQEMKLFRTHVEQGVVDGRYFFTSEIDPNNAKRWTVRECLPTGRVQTVGSFHIHPTLGAARRWLNRRLTQGEGT